MTSALLTQDSNWQLVVRDITDWAAVEGQDATFLCVVLDTDQSRVRAVGTGDSPSEARVRALTTAATEPAAPFAPGLPECVVCAPEAADDVRDDVAAALEGLAGELPPVVEERTSPVVEEFLDEVVAQLSGGGDALPTEEEWRALVGRTREFALAAPWATWPADLQLHAELTADGESESYVVAVLGADNMLSGLVLYPGRDQSDVILPAEDWQPTDSLPFRPGTLLLHLNAPDDAVEDMVDLALEFDWPADAAVMPVWLAAGPEGFADIDGVQAVRLTLALSAVLARARQPFDTAAPPLTGDGFVVTDLPRGGVS